MTPSSFARLKEAFMAVQGLDDEARERHLAALHAHDRALHDALRSFLDYQASTSGSLALRAPDGEMDSAEVLQGTRYENRGWIGRGGMGVVLRVYDPLLRRTLALKFLRSVHHLHPDLRHRQAITRRFVREAQTQAQLQHPGIVPVYERADLPDGRPFLTMQEVQGQTLREVIAAVHAASAQRWRPALGGWTLRRLLTAFLQACSAIGFAHQRGVIHRDMKPDNVMLGAFGEALVLDWGLAKVAEAPDLGDLDGIELDPTDTVVTQQGTISGTPGYMSPEQASGARSTVDARADVYALGAILYRILSNRDPYDSTSLERYLEAIRTGPPPLSCGAVEGPEPPPDLVQICERAMARAPADRFATAAELGLEVQAWLDGAKARDRARALVRAADAHLTEAEALRARARQEDDEAKALLAPIKPWAPENDKAPGWAHADEALRLRRLADLETLAYLGTLSTALNQAPAGRGGPAAGELPLPAPTPGVRGRPLPRLDRAPRALARRRPGRDRAHPGVADPRQARSAPTRSTFPPDRSAPRGIRSRGMPSPPACCGATPS